MMNYLHYLTFVLVTFSVISESKPNRSYVTTLKSLCHNTFYSKTCYDTLSRILDPKRTYSCHFLYNVSLRASAYEVSRLLNGFSENGALSQMLEGTKEELALSALESCREFLSLALYNLDMSVPADATAMSKHENRANFRTWLSAAGSDLQTCMDGLEYAPNVIRATLAAYLEKSKQLVTTSLAIISKVDEYMRWYEEASIVDTTEPQWLTSEDREMIQSSKEIITPDAVVASDGSGNYKTIAEAVDVVPPNSNRRFVIYVKKGVYHENVRVTKKKWNVMMYGDGMDKTIVSSNRSNVTGSSTSMSATFAAMGKGFIARDMGFKNTAGPRNGQAVALLSASDQSVFYRCLIDGYQDTLFTQSNRQFYRECNIYGTIDFIFGDAAVVIQNSNILVRNSLHPHHIITAQGRGNPHANTGISIQKCRIIPAEDLGGATAFLGRPWGNYSTTVVMESYMDSLVDPLGWQPWHKDLPFPDTILYVEYNNTGPGAVTTQRVVTKGVMVNDTENVAQRFTVGSFIDGVQWLLATGVPFQPDL